MTRKKREVEPALVRFWRKVRPAADGSACLIWVGAINSGGYGNFADEDGRVRPAHRWLWEQIHGDVPLGLELDHLCRVRACINPIHLEPVTGSENQLRGNNPRLTRERAALRTHCKHGHAWTPANTYLDPKTNHRLCRTCRRLYQRQYRKVAA